MSATGQATKEVPLDISESVEDAVSYILEGRDQPNSSRPQTLALFAAHCGVRRLVALTTEQHAEFDAYHHNLDGPSPVLRIIGIRRKGPGHSTRLLHPCHVTMVRDGKPQRRGLFVIMPACSLKSRLSLHA
jgi:hypothetical protein